MMGCYYSQQLWTVSNQRTKAPTNAIEQQEAKLDGSSENRRGSLLGGSAASGAALAQEGAKALRSE